MKSEIYLKHILALTRPNLPCNYIITNIKKHCQWTKRGDLQNYPIPAFLSGDQTTDAVVFLVRTEPSLEISFQMRQFCVESYSSSSITQNCCTEMCVHNFTELQPTQPCFYLIHRCSSFTFFLSFSLCFPSALPCSVHPLYLYPFHLPSTSARL